MKDWLPFAEAVVQGVVDGKPDSVACAECQGSFKFDELIRLGDRFICEECKPLAVQQLQQGGIPVADEELRRKYLNHETSVRSVGSFLNFFGVLFVFIGVNVVFDRFGSNTVDQLIGLALAGFFAAICFLVAYGVRGLRGWSRIPVALLACLSLIGFPVGTVIGICVLWLYFCPRGRKVFSPEYRELVARTPAIKYQSSPLVRVLGWIVMLLFVVGAISGVLRQPE